MKHDRILNGWTFWWIVFCFAGQVFGANSANENGLVPSFFIANPNSAQESSETLQSYRELGFRRNMTINYFGKSSHVAVKISSPKSRTPKSGKTRQVSTLHQDIMGMDGFLVDSQGNLIAAGGWKTDKVLRMDRTGKLATLASGLSGPVHVALGSEGDIYVSEFNSHEVSKIDPSGKVTLVAKGLDAPTALAFDTEGNLWVANYGRRYTGQTVSKIRPSGEVVTALDHPLILTPIDLHFRKNGDLIIANQTNATILIAAPNGEVKVVAKLPEKFLGHMVVENDICYVTTLNRIYRVSLKGVVTVLTGQEAQGYSDGDLESAQFTMVNGLSFSPDKRSLITARATGGAKTNVIRKIILP